MVSPMNGREMQLSFDWTQPIHVKSREKRYTRLSPIFQFSTREPGGEATSNPACLPQLQFKDQKQSSCFVHALKNMKVVFET